MKKIKFNSLVKSSAIYILATGIGQGMSFLGIIVFTRLMSKADYGNYSTYYAFVSIFAVLIGSNLFYSLNNAYIDKAERIHEFRKSALFLSTCIAIPVSTLLIILGSVILNKTSWFVMLMASVHSYGFFLVNYRMSSANMENDYRRKQWLLILPNVCQFFFALGLIIAMPHSTFIARVIGSVCGVGIISGISYFKMMRCPGSLICRDDWKYALSISVPSIVMSLSYQLMQQCDKVMITNLCGSEETAVYSVIYYLGYAMIAVNMAIAPVRQAWIYKKLACNDFGSAKLLQKSYLFLFALIATIVVMFGRIAIQLIAPPSYWQFEYIVPFVAGACMMVIYPFYTDIILFYKKNMVLSLTIMTAAIINVVLNYICIGRYGAVAACYTTVASYFLIFVMTGKVADRCQKNVYSKKYFVVFLGWIGIIYGIDLVTKNMALLHYALFSVLLIVMLWYLSRNFKEFKTVIKAKVK